jgi:hypothetical protein
MSASFNQNLALCLILSIVSDPWLHGIVSVPEGKKCGSGVAGEQVDSFTLVGSGQGSRTDSVSFMSFIWGPDTLPCNVRIYKRLLHKNMGSRKMLSHVAAMALY